MYSPGVTPLHYAADGVSTELVQLLLEGGANANLQEDDGM